MHSAQIFIPAAQRAARQPASPLRALAAWALGLLLAPLSSEAQEPKRLALLIANQSYVAEVGPLKNPRNDIRHVGAALAQAGFDLGAPLTDATREQTLAGLHEFADRLAAAGPGVIGFLYYSGHGVAIGGDNVLVPVNVKSTSTRELEISGVKLVDITTTLSERAPHAVHFIVFDACRNNLAGTRGAKGFVPVAERPGMLIAFSTAPGSTASDEGEGGGPYAAALAAEMTVPGRNHDDMFFEVRRRVAQTTRQEQVPWTQDGLLRHVHFGGQAIQAPGPHADPSPTNEAAQVWTLTKETTDKAVLEAFIARYKGTFYAELARARLRELDQKPPATASLPAPSIHTAPASAPQGPPGQPPKHHPFDGIWEATFQGSQACARRSGAWTLLVQQGVVHHRSGSIGSVDAKGGLTIDLPSSVNPKVKVRHTIKLSGNSGAGTYRTLGGPCIGTTALQKSTGPAASAPAR